MTPEFIAQLEKREEEVAKRNVHLDERIKKQGFDKRTFGSFFVAGALNPWQSVMDPLVNFDQPAGEAATLKEAEEYKQ